MREKLKAKRIEMGYTQKSIAKKLCISIQTYQFIEQGRSFPREKLMYKLLTVLKVPESLALDIFTNTVDRDSKPTKRGDVANNICKYMNSRSNKSFTLHHVSAIRTCILLEYRERMKLALPIKSYTNAGKQEIYKRIASIVQKKYNFNITPDDVKLYKNCVRDEYCNRTGKTTWGIPEVRKKLGYNPTNGYQKR